MKILTIILGVIAIYFLPLMVWFVMINGCISYEEMNGQGYCGGDELTKVVKVIYKPLIDLL